MSSIKIKFSSADEKINYEMESDPDAYFNEFIENLYYIYPEYRETVNLFLYKGSSIYDDCTKKLSELKITNNARLILTQTDQRRKEEDTKKKGRKGKIKETKRS